MADDWIPLRDVVGRHLNKGELTAVARKLQAAGIPTTDVWHKEHGRRLSSVRTAMLPAIYAILLASEEEQESDIYTVVREVRILIMQVNRLLTILEKGAMAPPEKEALHRELYRLRLELSEVRKPDTKERRVTTKKPASLAPTAFVDGGKIRAGERAEKVKSRLCACGCGGVTVKGHFLPTHARQFYTLLLRVLDGKVGLGSLTDWQKTVYHVFRRDPTRPINELVETALKQLPPRCRKGE